MYKNITVKKGLDIPLKGEAKQKVTERPKSNFYALKPSDFHLIVPKLEKKEGDAIKAGEPLFHSKSAPDIKFVSPVSGTVLEIFRGPKRVITRIVIESDPNNNESITHEIPSEANLSAAAVKKILLDAGCWPFVKQRPYDVIADPTKTPKSIFISAYATAPLSAKPEFTIKEDKAYFQQGVYILSKLTSGKVNLCFGKDGIELFSDIKGADLYAVSGPHPAGNVGVQIQAIDPINPGEWVWTIAPQDVVCIGKLFATGVVDFHRLVALSGSEVEKPHYRKVIMGCLMSDLIGKSVDKKDKIRIISGDVLTGDKSQEDDFLGFYHRTVTVIPEGDNYRMLGWLPFKDNYIPSFYNTSLFRLGKKAPVVVGANLNGEARAMVVTGKMDKVLPMDIYPMQLLKECLANNVEKMELLGIYEVAPEDFALIDFISTSKIEAQEIIRHGLDLMMKEIG